MEPTGPWGSCPTGELKSTLLEEGMWPRGLPLQPQGGHFLGKDLFLALCPPAGSSTI